jgi:DNA ligase (NAD+)
MSKSRVQELIVKIGQAREFYYNGEGIMSDDEYDALVDELKDLDPTSILLNEIGAPISVDSRLKKVKHEIPMGSLDKINSEEELDKWLKKRSGDEIINWMIQEKLDGFSVEVIYENGKFKQAITRGDGTTGEDITHNAKHMQNVPAKLPRNFTGSLRGEAVIYKGDFEEYFDTRRYANPRNAAAGIARKKNTNRKLIKHLRVFFFDCIGDDIEFESEQKKLAFLIDVLKLKTVPSYLVSLYHEITARYELMQNDRVKLPYEIDALVLKIDDLSVQEELGDLHGRPRGQIAWKFAAEMRETVVEDISWEIGLTGRITPLAHLKPVGIGGVTISKVSLHNVTNVRNLGVGLGATVLVSRRNDVIPYVEKVTKQGLTAIIPKECPVCGSKLVFEGEFLLCKNEGGCPALKFGNIEKWIKVTEIEEAGQGFLADVGEAGLIKDVADLYKLTAKDLIALPGYQKKKAEKIINNIKSKKVLPLPIFMAALNIPNVGRTVFGLIEAAGYTSFDDVCDLEVEDLVKIEGIVELTAESVKIGVEKNLVLVRKLFKAGVKIEEKRMGKLSGMSFCFTGALSIKRSDAQKYVKSLGGEVKTGVSKGLTYLVQSDPSSNSSKSQKARKYGTEIIDEDQFMEMTDFSVDKLANL